MRHRTWAFALCTVVTTSACASDPARDRPIEPWASPSIEPATQIGDDGGGFRPEPQVDAGAPKHASR